MTDHKLTPRGPTDAMVLAGDAALPDNPDEHDAVSVWRAMHDAAPDISSQADELLLKLVRLLQVTPSPYEEWLRALDEAQATHNRMTYIGEMSVWL